MRIRRATAALAATAAVFAIPAVAGPAEAAPVVGAEVDCSTTGGSGWGSWTWNSRTTLTSVSLKAKDTKADGRHPAIRLVTVNAAGNVKHWSWHHVYGGLNASETWNTSAEDSNGIKRASIEVGIFDGSTYISSLGCGSSGPLNPKF